MRMREGEPRAVRGQGVEIRRGGLAAVRAQRVSAQGVDRDQEDVLIGILREDVGWAFPRPPEGREAAGRNDQDNKATGPPTPSHLAARGESPASLTFRYCGVILLAYSFRLSRLTPTSTP